MTIAPELAGWLIVALVGGILSLDATAAVQSMVSQPIATGTLVGAALGDPVTGLAVGALAQTLFPVELPLGASVPGDACAATAATTGAAILVSHATSPAPPLLVLSVSAALLAWPLAWVAGRADVAIRRWNGRFGDFAEHGLAAGRPAAVDLAMWGGVGLFLAKGIVVVAVLTLVANTLLDAAIGRRALAAAFTTPAAEWAAVLLPAGAAGLLAKSLATRLVADLPAIALAAFAALALQLGAPAVPGWVGVVAGTGLGAALHRWLGPR